MPKMTLIVAKFSLEHLATPGPSVVSLPITEPGSAQWSRMTESLTKPLNRGKCPI